MKTLCTTLDGKEGDSRWIQWIKIVRKNISVGDRETSGLIFMHSVGSILLEEPKKNILNYTALIIRIIKKWYIDGIRPSSEWCRKQFELEKKRGQKSKNRRSHYGHT